MLFKKVDAAQFGNYDQETVELYAKRKSPEALTQALLKMDRDYRNRLPVLASKDHPWVKEHKTYIDSVPRQMLVGYCFFAFATYQFSKIYFPYGIIVRRSIPQTWAQYISYRAPIGFVFLYLWYYQREYPRRFRADMTSDTEQ